MELLYTARFLRSLKKLPEEIQEQVVVVLEVYRADQKHPLLKPHKLSGKWKGYQAIAAGFHHRIILKISKKETYCMDIGTHDVYR